MVNMTLSTFFNVTRHHFQVHSDHIYTLKNWNILTQNPSGQKLKKKTNKIGLGLLETAQAKEKY